MAGGAPEIDVRDLLAVPKERRGDAARRFLIDSGIQTTALPAKDLEAEAETRGINYRTLRRAREDLGVPAWQEGFHGGWWWGPRTEDNDRGQITVLPLSPVDPPAQTLLTEHTGDTAVVAGERS